MVTKRKNRNLKCVQINLQHSRFAPASLSQLILDFEIDVVLVQEPYTATNQTIPNIPLGYFVLHSLSNDPLYGAIMILKKDLRSSTQIIMSL